MGKVSPAQMVVICIFDWFVYTCLFICFLAGAFSFTMSKEFYDYMFSFFWILGVLMMTYSIVFSVRKIDSKHFDTVINNQDHLIDLISPFFRLFMPSVNQALRSRVVRSRIYLFPIFLKNASKIQKEVSSYGKGLHQNIALIGCFLLLIGIIFR